MTIRRARLGSLFSWVSKGSFAILDQGLFAGANFTMNILLARWLTPTQYGAFALIFSIFLFMAGLYNAFLLEPMSVLGPANHHEHFRRYLGSLVWLHGGFTLILSLFLIFATGFMLIFSSQSYLANPLLGLAASLPFTLSLWLFRRAFYLRHCPEGALLGSIFYGILLILGLSFMKYMKTVSPFLVFLLIGLVSFIVTIAVWRKLNPQFDLRPKSARSSIVPISAEHWHYGRWVAVTGIVCWISGNAYYIFITGFLGLEGTAALRAMQNLVLPVSQVTIALNLLLLPWASRRFTENGFVTIKRDVLWINAIMFGFAGFFFIAVIVLGNTLVNLLYSGKYREFMWLLPYLAGVSVITALGNGWGIGLKSIQLPKAVLISYSASALSTISLGFIAVYLWRLKGVAVSSLVSYMAFACTMGMLWRKYSRSGVECEIRMR